MGHGSARVARDHLECHRRPSRPKTYVASASCQDAMELHKLAFPERPVPALVDEEARVGARFRESFSGYIKDN